MIIKIILFVFIICSIYYAILSEKGENPDPGETMQWIIAGIIFFVMFVLSFFI